MSFKIALSQINSCVGDFEGNRKKIIGLINRAKKEHVKLVIFPELAITGYPPMDLLFNKGFLEKNTEVLDDITRETEGIGVIVGFVDFYKEKFLKSDTSSSFSGRTLILHNAACFLQNCKLIGKIYKVHLPNYDIFNEKRYFDSGKECPVFDFENEKIGISICEDMWVDKGPIEEQVKRGATIIINISASPFYAGKHSLRKKVISQKAVQNHVPVVYVNMVGGQDELIFDGSSYVFSKHGNAIAIGKSFEEDFLIVNSLDGETVSCDENVTQNVFNALVLGARDYVHKNGFQQVVIGLSGGIDSALTAIIACEALGSENVTGLLMPGPFSSQGSLVDAQQLVNNTGMCHKVVNIETIYHSYCAVLREHFEGKEMDVTEENIQARIRGNILMAFANKFGLLVLSTGNKSELAVGYSTLYGDMAGGLAVMADVPKTMVYKLARYYNSIKERDVIGQEILKKPPSAELRSNQKDSDDLPSYEMLDEILDLYIENGLSSNEIIEKGFEKKLVSDIIVRVKKSEFKRKQAPVGLRITPKSFGFGRRMPITNKFMQ